MIGGKIICKPNFKNPNLINENDFIFILKETIVNFYLFEFSYTDEMMQVWWSANHTCI